MRKFPIPSDELAALIQERHWRDGLSLKQVAKEAGANYDTMRKAAKRYGIAVRSPGESITHHRTGRDVLTEGDRAHTEHAIQTWHVEGGLTLDQVAERVGLPRETLRYRCRKWGIALLPASASGVRFRIAGQSMSRRLLANMTVNDASGCWEYNNPHHTGYGMVTRAGRRHQAHRLSYEAFVGPIPDGMMVCHKCDNRPCINPNHLFLGTGSDNAMDMHAKGRFPVKRGVQVANAKLNDSLVADARRRAANGESIAAIAREIGVTLSCLHAAVRGHSWKHVKEPL